MPRPKSFSDPTEFKANEIMNKKGEQLTKYELYGNQSMFKETFQKLKKRKITVLTPEEADKSGMNYGGIK